MTPLQGTYAEVLQTTAERQSTLLEIDAATATYGQLMGVLAAQHLAPWIDGLGVTHGRLSYAQMAEQCYVWAQTARGMQRWTLANDFDATGQQWQQWAEQEGGSVARPSTITGTLLSDPDDPALEFLS